MPDNQNNQNQLPQIELPQIEHNIPIPPPAWGKGKSGGRYSQLVSVFQPGDSVLFPTIKEARGFVNACKSAKFTVTVRTAPSGTRVWRKALENVEPSTP